MLNEVIMPKLGQTVEEATVEQWHKQEGDAVKKGEVLLEITTDKATLEVEALVSGTLRKILVAKDEVVPVGELIAYIGDPSDELPADLGRKRKAAVADKPAPAEAGAPAGASAPAVAVMTAPAGRQFISPRAKRRAAKDKVPAAVLIGTGPNGRVIERDVLGYLDKRAAVKFTPTALEVAYQRGVDLLTVQPKGERIQKEDVMAAEPAVRAAAAPVAGQREELSAMRRIIAERMSLSKREIPHFYLGVEVDMTAAVGYRKTVNAAGGPKVSFNDMIAKTCAAAFVQVPAMNKAWDNGATVAKGEISIGVAVALDSGLIVPVVRNVDRKSLTQLAAESADLVERARGKRLTPDEYGGGSLTLSNLGMLGIDSFIPIINPGESAILGIGRIKEKPVVIDGGIHVRSMMEMTLSCDHRIVDGAAAAQFLQIVVSLLENPEGIA